MLCAHKPYVYHHQIKSPGSFEKWDEVFQASLAEKSSLVHLDDVAWARVFSETLIETTQSLLTSKLSTVSQHTDKRLVLNALIEIATAVAFAPSNAASDLIRKGAAPVFLMDSMFKIMLTMSTEDAAHFKGDTFPTKVRELRQTTGECWNDQTWEDLDDISRLLRDFSGPISFRKGLEEIHRLLSTQAYDLTSRRQAEDYIIRFIQNEISGIVTQNSLFDTKRSALNALADIGIAVLETSAQLAIIWKPLDLALLKICKTLTKDEITLLVKDIPALTGATSPSLLEDFSGSGPELVVILRALIEMNTFKNVSYSIFINDMAGCPPEQSEPLANLLHRHERAQQTQSKRHPDGKGFLLKLLYLRWTKRRQTSDNWDPRTLNSVIDLAFDKPPPLNTDQVLKDVSQTFPHGYAIVFRGYSPQRINEMRGILNNSITQVSQAKDAAGLFEKKVHILSTLTTIAAQFCGCMKDSNIPSSLDPYNTFFKDQKTEQQLTDCMFGICSSMEKSDLEKLRSDKSLIDNIITTGHARLPGMYPGLDAVLSILRPNDDASVLSNCQNQQHQRMPTYRKLPVPSKISSVSGAKKSLPNFSLEGIEIVDLSGT